MKLILGLPKELDLVKENNIPLVIAGGTVEYHGTHCAYGCDGIIVEKLLEKLEMKREIVIAPSIWYSPSSYAVGGKESGTVHIPEKTFEDYCYYTFLSLLYSGFKNIYVVIHHQFEEESLMPMTLCYKMAAKRATMDYLQQTKGEGWWGSENYKNYYTELEGKNNPFSWIKVIPTMTTQVQKATGYDHAGEFECSILMALENQAVDLKRIGDVQHWFAESAKKSNMQLGNKMVELTLKSLNERIK